MAAHLADTPVLETERFVLRAPKVDDFDAMRAFFASDRAKYVGGPVAKPRPAWNILGHMIGHWAMRGFGLFVITEKGSDTGLGGVGPWFPATWPEREIGWTCWDTAREGTGMMAECAAATLRHAFGDLGWDTAVSYIDPKNSRSIALAKRLGAALDPSAQSPGDDPCSVYRHSGALYGAVR